MQKTVRGTCTVSTVYLALTLKLPIQTSLSVVPKLPLSLSSADNVKNSGKRAHPLIIYHLIIFQILNMKGTDHF